MAVPTRTRITCNFTSKIKGRSYAREPVVVVCVGLCSRMRMRLGRLREVLGRALSEAPLAGIEEPGIDPNFRDSNKPKDARAVQRFFKGKKFADDAVRLYRNLAVPIYLVPLYSARNRQFTKSNREQDVTVEDLMAGGLSRERADEIGRAVQAGACALVVAASTLTKGGLPTPMDDRPRTDRQHEWCRKTSQL